MLLTLTTTHPHADNLGYLLHKHPQKVQQFDLSFGKAHVYYPEASTDRCTAALLLDVNSIDIVRGKGGKKSSFALGQYVNDRPYIASSFLSVAIAQVFGSALGGKCKDRPQAVGQVMPLVAQLDVLPVRAGDTAIHELFEPLGYQVSATPYPLDPMFPEWGNSPYYSVTLQGTATLSALLSHLYVLIPVFDNAKHYFIGKEELEKLLAKGAGWLANHPKKEWITRRYLRHRGGLVRQALARLEDIPLPEDVEQPAKVDHQEEELEQPISLNTQRLHAVVEVLKESSAKSVVDLGCGEGKLLHRLFKEKQFSRLVGLDVSLRSLEIAHRRLRVEQLPERQRDRLSLMHGSLMYRDKRIDGFDAAAVVEVIEHLDPPRLSAFERVAFEFAKPKLVVVTTPNAEYNVKWESLPAGKFRHSDHRFEWTRAEFESWSKRVAERFSYRVRFSPVGPVDEVVGSPTQMGVFERD